jgi:hypothetical protein
MKLNPPAELASYTYDPKASSRSAMLPRVFGWLSFLLLLGAISSFIFLAEQQAIKLSLVTAFFILFVIYVILKIKKRRLLCTQCQKNVEVVDVKWTPEEWQQKQGYELIGGFTGADGNLYSIETLRRPGSITYFIHSHSQRWYVCHACRLYFLGARYLRGTVFSSIREEEFEEAKNSILTDPKASEKMEAAYQERLQGGS